MSKAPLKAMVLAAGRGERMKPLTNDRPKVLVDVAGKPLIDHVLDQLANAGIQEAVVNYHYMADMVLAHLEGRQGPPRLSLSDERDVLLETGGGTAKALPHFGGQPILAVNADAVWLQGGVAVRSRLADFWDESKMDALLLLVPKQAAVGLDGPGDFSVDGDGSLHRRPKDGTAPTFYSGTQIVHPRLFDGCPEGPFSFNVLWDKAAAGGRLYGVVAEGETWLHVGSPQGRDDAERILRGG